MTTSISQEKTEAAPATAATKARVAKRPAPVTPAKGLVSDGRVLFGVGPAYPAIARGQA